MILKVTAHLGCLEAPVGNGGFVRCASKKPGIRVKMYAKSIFTPKKSKFENLEHFEKHFNIFEFFIFYLVSMHCFE